MKGFVQIAYQFPEHARIFYVSQRSWKQLAPFLVATFGVSDSDAPEKRQKILQQLVEKVRPYLKNCVVYALNYNVEIPGWDICVSHPDLPKVGDGIILDREPLIPSTWRDEPSML